MDDRYLRFPRWLEAACLPAAISGALGIEAWVLFRRLVEEDILQNLFPDWVDLVPREIASPCALTEERLMSLFLSLGGKGYLRIRQYGEDLSVYQYRIARPLPIPLSPQELRERLEEARLPERPEVWRYWEEGEGDTKYERIVRLYEATCGLKISGRIVEDLVELAETYPFSHLQEGFEAASKEGVTTLAWIRKYLKRLQKHERVQKAWGRPGGLELPEGYTVPTEQDSKPEGG